MISDIGYDFHAHTQTMMIVIRQRIDTIMRKKDNTQIAVVKNFER